MKNRRLQAWFLVFALLIGQICGGHALAAMDASKSFTVTLLLDGQAECYAKEGDIVTVSLRITQDGAEDTFRFLTTEDTLIYDPEYLKIVAPNEDVNGDGEIDIQDSFTLGREPGKQKSLVGFRLGCDEEDGTVHFITNVYSEDMATYGFAPVMVPVNVMLLSFPVQVLKEGNTTIGHMYCDVIKDESTSYVTTTKDATLHIISDELLPQEPLTLTSADAVTYGETLALSATGGTGDGAVTYAVTGGTGRASIVGNDVLSPTQAGTVTVTATKASDGVYAAVSSAPRTVTIGKATPTGAPSYSVDVAENRTLADAQLSAAGIKGVGGGALSGTIRWDLAPTTAIEANRSYGWTFTPDDAVNYEPLTGSAVLCTGSTGGGSGGTTPDSGDGGEEGPGSDPEGATPNTPYILSLVSAGTATAPVVYVQLRVINGTLDEYRSVDKLAFTLDYDAGKLSLMALTAADVLQSKPMLMLNNGTLIWKAFGEGPITIGTEPVTIATAEFVVVDSRKESIPVGFADENVVNTTEDPMKNSLGAMVGCNVAADTSALRNQAPLSIQTTETTYGAPLTLAIAGGDGNGAVSYRVTKGTPGNATLEGGILIPAEAGTVTVTATKASDGTYAATSSAPTVVTIRKATPTGTPSYDNVMEGDTLGDAHLAVGSITPSAGTLIWDAGDDTVTVAGTAYGWTFTPYDWENYTSLTGSIDLSFRAQEPLEITSADTMTYGETLALTYTGGSGGGAVRYEVTNGTGEATVGTNGVLRTVRAGTVTVIVKKAAAGIYTAASSKPQTITINKATPTGEPGYDEIVDLEKTLADAHLRKGGISLAGTVAWDLSEDTVVAANTEYGWTFTPDDTVNYSETTGRVLLYSASEQEPITITSADTMSYGETLALTFAGGSGDGAVTYEVTDGTGKATVDERGVLTATQAGTVTVVVKKAAAGTCLAASSAPQTITVRRAAPTGEPYYDRVLEGGTLAQANLSVGTIAPAGTIRWDTGDETSVEPNRTYAWTFTPDDAVNYEPMTGNASLTLQHQEPLRITSADAMSYGETMALTFTGGSGDGAVTYEVTDGTGRAAVDEQGVLTAQQIGTVTVVVQKAAEGVYIVASSAPQTITIGKATPAGEPSYDRITDLGRTLADAHLQNGGVSLAGTVAWDMPEDTVVEANTAYGWTFTPEDTANYNTTSGSVVLYSASEQEPIIITSAGTVTYGRTLALTYRGGSGTGAVTYEVTNGTGSATVSGSGVLTATRAGTVTVVVRKAAAGAYLAASSAPRTITIGKATPTGAPSYAKVAAAGKTLADANLTLGTISPGGRIAWDLGDAAAVESGKTYSWTFTPNDTVNYTTLTGVSEILYTASSGGGGGAGGGGAPAPVETKPDEGKDTAADASPVSVSVTATTTAAGTTTAAVSEKAGEELVKAAKKDATKDVVVTVEAKTSADAVTVSVPAKTVQSLARDTDASLTVESSAGSATISNNGLAELAKNGGEVSISVSTAEETRSANVIVTAGGNAVTEVAGGVKVTLPAFAEASSDSVLVVIRSDGSEEVLPFGIVTSEGAKAVLDGSATVVVRNVDKELPDMAGHWAATDVSFVAARGIFNGGDDGDFHPESTMTRGMLVQTLYNLERQQGQQYDGNGFSDVGEHAWYKDSVGWAASTGLMSGYGDGGFGPEDMVTREQVAKVLYAYIQYLGVPVASDALTLEGFSDQNAVDEWALEPMSWAVSQGIFLGTESGELNPQGEATRAEMAAIMARFVKIVLQ